LKSKTKFDFDAGFTRLKSAQKTALVQRFYYKQKIFLNSLASKNFCTDLTSVNLASVILVTVDKSRAPNSTKNELA
jgi:hypothetical protein